MLSSSIYTVYTYIMYNRQFKIPYSANFDRENIDG